MTNEATKAGINKIIDYMKVRISVERATHAQVAKELGIHLSKVSRLARKYIPDRPSASESMRRAILRPEMAGRHKAREFLLNATKYDGDDCLIWPFYRHKTDGHATAKFNGKQTSAARIVCEIVHGSAPSRKHQAAHSCGNGHLGCVNQKHIRWATNKENSDDRIMHGTMIFGEKNPMCKFSEDEIDRVRQLAGRMPKRTIARSTGISEAHVHSILKGERRAVKGVL